jgi:hypothetical protein
VAGLSALSTLQSLDLGHCKALQEVDVLSELAPLQTLNLNGCHALMPPEWRASFPDKAACETLRREIRARRAT